MHWLGPPGTNRNCIGHPSLFRNAFGLIYLHLRTHCLHKVNFKCRNWTFMVKAKPDQDPGHYWSKMLDMDPYWNQRIRKHWIISSTSRWLSLTPDHLNGCSFVKGVKCSQIPYQNLGHWTLRCVIRFRFNCSSDHVWLVQSCPYDSWWGNARRRSSWPWPRDRSTSAESRWVIWNKIFP